MTMIVYNLTVDDLVLQSTPEDPIYFALPRCKAEHQVSNMGIISLEFRVPICLREPVGSTLWASSRQLRVACQVFIVEVMQDVDDLESYTILKSSGPITVYG